MNKKSNNITKIDIANFLKNAVIVLTFFFANTIIVQAKMNTQLTNKTTINCLTMSIKVKKNQNQAIWINGVQVIVYNMICLTA